MESHSAEGLEWYGDFILKVAGSQWRILNKGK